MLPLTEGVAHGFTVAEATADPDLKTCGFIDPMFGVACTMPAGHPDVMHRDLSDSGVLLAWREEPCLGLEIP